MSLLKKLREGARRAGFSKVTQEQVDQWHDFVKLGNAAERFKEDVSYGPLKTWLDSRIDMLTDKALKLEFSDTFGLEYARLTGEIKGLKVMAEEGLDGFISDGEQAFSHLTNLQKERGDDA